MIEKHVYTRRDLQSGTLDALVGKRISRWREHFGGSIEIECDDGTHAEFGAVPTLDPIDGVTDTHATLIYIIRPASHTPNAPKTRQNPPGVFTK